MRDDERRQAAAQRCADLAEKSCGMTVHYHLNSVAVTLALQLDELARAVAKHFEFDCQHDFVISARQHILPKPKPSPVERLALATTAFTDNLSATSLEGLIGQLGLELREKSS